MRLSWSRIRLQCERPGFDPWVGKIPWRRKLQPTPVSLPGKSHGQRTLVGYSPQGCKRVRHVLATKQQQQRDNRHDRRIVSRHVCLLQKKICWNGNEIRKTSSYPKYQTLLSAQDLSPGLTKQQRTTMKNIKGPWGEEEMDREPWEVTGKYSFPLKAKGRNCEHCIKWSRESP